MRYPCTGPTDTSGFADFLARELGAPRANIRRFADELAARFAAERITLVNSGSSANLVAALALSELREDRPVALASAFTFPTTASALALAGFRVRLVDVAPDSFNVDPLALDSAMGADVAVVCVTHMLGMSPDLPSIRSTVDRWGAHLLQDACETLGSRVAGRWAHEYGGLLTWSFYHPHHLSSFGGGAVVSTTEPLHRLCESIGHWGRACSCHAGQLPCPAPDGPAHNFTYERLGLNVEMSELNACFGRFALRTWEAQEAARRTRYDLLYEALADLADIRVWAPPDPDHRSPFVFPFALPAPQVRQVAAELARWGVETRTLMGGVVADQPAFADLRGASLDNARGLATRSLFVGVHQTLPIDDVARTADIVRSVLASL